MTEEEMVEAAIRAGEEAADNDFKVEVREGRSGAGRGSRAACRRRGCP
ncbi:MAG: hypothetical protein ACLTSX_10305 [Collinsella sp.]